MNKDLNKKMRQFAETPDAKVWESVEKRLSRRAWMRRAGVASAAAVVVAGVLLFATRQVDETERAVAQVSSQEIKVADATSAMPAVVEEVPADAVVRPAEPAVVKASKPAAPQVEPEEKAVAVVAQPQHTPVGEAPSAASQPRQTEERAVTPSRLVEPQAPMLEVAVEELPAAVEAEPEDSLMANEMQPSKALVEEPEQHQALWIPNVFYPKADDERSRVFKVSSSVPLKSYSIYIYNRSGRLVYHSKEIDSYWDGTFSGTPMPQGAYIYVISYVDMDGEGHKEKGSVLLLR